MKVWRNKRGNLCANTSYRKVSVVSAATFDALTERLAKAEAALAKATALPAKA
jgi:hypothetical protein